MTEKRTTEYAAWTFREPEDALVYGDDDEAGRTRSELERRLAPPEPPVLPAPPASPAYRIRDGFVDVAAVACGAAVGIVFGFAGGFVLEMRGVPASAGGFVIVALGVLVICQALQAARSKRAPGPGSACDKSPRG